MTVNLNTMVISHKLVTRKGDRIEVHNLNNRTFIKQPPLYTKVKMPVFSYHIPRNEDIARWDHLEELILP